MTVGSPGPQFMFEGTLTFASVGAGATADQTVTLPNSAKFMTDDAAILDLRLPDLQAGLTYCNPIILSQTTFKVRFTNTTGGGLTPTGTNAMLVVR